jgi:hypothetical protein
MAGWMSNEGAREKRAGTKGSFTRIAERHGRSVHEEAEADKHKGGKVGKKALMALAFEKAAKNR